MQDYFLYAQADVADGTPLNNRAVFGGGVFVNGDGSIHMHGAFSSTADTVGVTTVPAGHRVTWNANTVTVAAPPSIRIWTHGGGDTITVPSGVSAPIIAFGGDGNDTIPGGSGNDYLYGNAGDDLIQGFAGNDYLDAGDGVDRAYGGLDNDQVFGGVGNDTLRGDDGNDSLFGDAGTDHLTGGNGVDALDGGSGGNTLLGNAGDDTYRIGDTFASDNTVTDDSGIDTVNLSSWTGPVALAQLGNVAGSFQNLNPAGTVRLSLTVANQLENAIGTFRNDEIYGNFLANRLEGGDATTRFTGASAMIS